MEKTKFKMNFKTYQIIGVFLVLIFFAKLLSAEAYFDLSENEIKIETDFNGKEIILSLIHI